MPIQKATTLPRIGSGVIDSLTIDTPRMPRMPDRVRAIDQPAFEKWESDAQGEWDRSFRQIREQIKVMSDLNADLTERIALLESA